MGRRGKAKKAVAVAISVSMLASGMSGGHTLQSYGAVSGTYGLISEVPGEKTVVSNIAMPSAVRLVDKEAVSGASELYAYLEGVGKSDYVLYGHQNDTHHKGGGTYEGSTNSDTKDLTGSIAAICGMDSLSLTGAELGIPEGESDSVDEAVALSVQAADEGAIITFSAHMPNFARVAQKGKNAEGKYDYSGYSPADSTGDVMAKILPGGELNEVYNGFLDLIAEYGLALQNQGIPVMFRPLHENNGSWFWWGAAFCDEEGYKNVYRYTVEYLRDVKDVHNFLYMYSPNGPFESEQEYESRYPGDAYVDILAFDMYHDNPESVDNWMESFRDTIALVERVADRHGKLSTVSETGMRVTSSLGDGKNYGGIAPFGNQRLDWFSEVEAIVAASDMPYFMVWANFDAVDNFFTPYRVDAAHGHEMSDAFIRFYNSSRSVFADGTNFYGQVSQPFVAGCGLEGYFLSPVSGTRMLTPGNVRVSLSDRAQNVTVILSNEENTVQYQVRAEEKAGVNGIKNIYTAQITREMLDGLGETVGTMELQADGKSLSTVKVIYNIEKIEQEPLAADRFEDYHGKSALMQKEWSTNSGSGCGVTPELTADHKSEGEYGAAFRYQLSSASGEGWAGMTKPLEADWSRMNALQLWIQPDGRGQKLVVQLTSGGEDFEVYLPEFAATTTAQYVTVPFAAMRGKNGGAFNSSAITSFGLWCNTIGQVNFDSVIYVDDIHAVNTDSTAVIFSDVRTESEEAQPAAEEVKAEPVVTVTEILPEGSYEKYETSDVSWLNNSAPTDYVTVEYTCTDAEKGGWGILGWGATVDGQWISGPSYNASAENPTEKASAMISIQALRRNFKLSKGGKLEGIYLTGWNGGRITKMTLTQGATIPRSPILLENAAADVSWICPDIEYLRDLPDDKILSLTITCNNPGHSNWQIMSWGAKVNGQWVEGPKYNASKPSSQKMQISYTMRDFRSLMGMTEDASVEYLSLSAYNGGQIIRLAIDDARQPSFAYKAPSGGSSTGGTKKDYVSPNGSKYWKLADRAEKEAENTLRFDELSGNIGSWGQLNEESTVAAAYIKPGNYMVVKYSSTDGDTVPALWPKAKAGIYEENYRTVNAAWSNGTYAVFTYDAIAARLKKCLLPADLESISITAGGSGSLDIEWLAVVSDGELELVNEMNRITEQYAQHKLDLTDYNSEYKKGDEVTVTVTLDREAKGYIGTNIAGVWDQGGELSGQTFVRSMKPDSGDVYVSISDFKGAPYVEITDVRVDIAGKVNYDAAVEMNVPQSLGIVGLDAKELTEAAGMTQEEVTSGSKLVVTMEEVTDEVIIRQVEEKLEKETVNGKKTTALAVIDISLAKQQADGTSKALTSTAGKLKFTFAVPEGADVSQKFVVARIHEGQVEWLEDLDDNPNTVTVESDKFSEYVIASVEIISDEQIAENAVYAYNNLSRLKSVMEKAANGEPVTVAFLGGSITNGSVAQPQATSCYAYLTRQWWEKTFPDADITYVNAGIGATDSYLGVHRVATDVLSYDPDLVVVEFSVNDYRDHNQESYESLIRRILQSETSPAVVSLFVTQWSTAGKVADYSDYHKEVVDYYNIPAVSYRDVVGPMLENGSLKWTDIGPADDLTHPNNTGHKIISRCMTCFFDQVLADTAQEKGDYEDYEIPAEPMTYSRYENGQILDNRSSDGISIDGNVEKVTVSEAQFPYGWKTTTGNDVTFTVEDATNIGLIYYGGMSDDYGKYDVYVDGTYKKTIDTNFYGSWGSHADYEILLTGGTAGSHDITLKENAGSTGNFFTVLGFTVSSSDVEAPDAIYTFRQADIKPVDPNNPDYKEASHGFTLTDYLADPIDIGKDVVNVEVVLESEDSFSGSVGLGSVSETNPNGDWVAYPFSGSGEITVSFKEIPQWDNMIIAVNHMDADTVSVKSIKVTKAEALTPDSNTCEFDISDYLEDYEAGDEITATVVFSREVGATVGTQDDAGDVLSGKEVSRTFVPDSGQLKVAVTDFKGASEVQIKDVYIERKGLHTFTGPWESLETTFSTYNADFMAGAEVTVTVKLDKEATGNIAGNEKNVGWSTGDPLTGTSFVRTFVPADDYLNLYLTDMGGNDRVQILSITVEQGAEPEEAIHTFTALWNDGALVTTLSAYNADFVASEEVTITVELDKSATGNIAGNEQGIGWSTGDSLTGTSFVRTFVPADDYLNLYLTDMGGNDRVQVLSITVEQEAEPEVAMHTFTGTWGDDAFVTELSSYMENPDSFQLNVETTVYVTLDEAVQVKLGGATGENAAWTESNLENSTEIEWTFTPATDALNVQVGTTGVSILSIEVTQKMEPEDAVYTFSGTWGDDMFETDLSSYMENSDSFQLDVETTVYVAVDKAGQIKLGGSTGASYEWTESTIGSATEIEWTFTPSVDKLCIQTGIAEVSILSIMVEQNDNEVLAAVQAPLVENILILDEITADVPEANQNLEEEVNGSKDEIGRDELNVPEDEIDEEESNAPDDVIVDEELNTPEDEIGGEESNTPKDEINGEESNAQEDEIDGEESNAQEDEIGEEESNAQEDEIGEEESNAPKNEIGEEESNAPENEIGGEELGASKDETKADSEKTEQSTGKNGVTPSEAAIIKKDDDSESK